MTQEFVVKEVCDERHTGMENLCDERHSNIEHRFEGIEAFMKEQADLVKQLNEAVIKLSSIAESMNQMMNFIFEERKQKEEAQTTSPPNNSKLWQQSWFKWPVMACSIALILLILTSIGNQVASSVPWMQSLYSTYHSK